MNALLASLTAAGITLTVDGDTLRYTAPVGALTPALREQIAANKPALLALLAAEHATESPQDAPHGRVPAIDQQQPTDGILAHRGDACPHDWRLAGPPFGGITCDRCGQHRPAQQTVTPEELAYLQGVFERRQGRGDVTDRCPTCGRPLRAWQASCVRPGWQRRQCVAGHVEWRPDPHAAEEAP